MSAVRDEVIALDTLISDEAIREVLLTVQQQVTKRIFDEGLAANGRQIGQYSEGYVRQRQKKGLGTGRKVVVEFSGQTRNDFQLIPTSEGYGMGFLNKANGDKSRWVEATYNKPIFSLTTGEEDLLNSLLEQKANELLNG